MRLGRCHHTIQENSHVLKQTLHSFSFETCGVTQRYMNLIFAADRKLEACIEDRALNIQFNWIKVETAEFHLRQWILVKQHSRLEEGVAAEIPIRTQRLDQLSERDVLMGIGRKRCFTHAGQQFTKTRIAMQARPQHYFIGE